MRSLIAAIPNLRARVDEDGDTVYELVTADDRFPIAWRDRTHGDLLPVRQSRDPATVRTHGINLDANLFPVLKECSVCH